MGYELDMRFGMILEWSYKEYLEGSKFSPGVWVNEVGRVDLSKCGYDSEIYNAKKDVEGEETIPAMFYRTVKNRDFEVNESGERSAEPFDEERDDEAVVEDCYGTKMSLVDGYVALAALCMANRQCVREDGDTYRRFDVAIAALAAFLKVIDKEGRGKYGKREIPVVYFYGH